MTPLDLWLWVWFDSCEDRRLTQSRSSGVAGQAWRTPQLLQLKSVELNWVKLRTSHELNWLNWARLMWITPFYPGLTFSVVRFFFFRIVQSFPLRRFDLPRIVWGLSKQIWIKTWNLERLSSIYFIAAILRGFHGSNTWTSAYKDQAKRASISSIQTFDYPTSRVSFDLPRQICLGRSKETLLAG